MKRMARNRARSTTRKGRLFPAFRQMVAGCAEGAFENSPQL
jgi:hypothetical protein